MSGGELSDLKGKLDVYEVEYRKAYTQSIDGFLECCRIAADAKEECRQHDAEQKFVEWCEQLGVKKSLGYQMASVDELVGRHKKLRDLRHNLDSSGLRLLAQETTPKDVIKAVVRRANKMPVGTSAIKELLKQQEVSHSTRVEKPSPPSPQTSVDEPIDGEYTVDQDHEPDAEDSPAEPAETMSEAEQAVANADVGKAILNSINAAIRGLKQLPEVPGTELLRSRHQAITRDLNMAKGGVQLATPHAVCPRCKGERCVQCGNHGWVNSKLYKDLTS